MFRSRPLFFVFVLALSTVGALPQTPTPSTSPTFTTATCGKSPCTWTAFSNTYTRHTGQPEAVSNTFTVLNPNTQFTLHIDNNGVSSAIIAVNGVQVFDPSDFNPNVTVLDRPVTLAANNTLEVQLRGIPGTSLTLTVIGVDNDPPSISENEAPPVNPFGWQNIDVDITFTCGDSTSGIAICPKPVLLTTEGLNQVVTGTAFDLAGNSEAITFNVSIDKTPPTILPTQNPPANSFDWHNTPVTVTFLCSDTLSGVQACTPPILVSSEGQNQSVIGVATDFASNSASASTAVSIDLTPPTLSISSPANGAKVTAGSIQVTGSISDSLSGLASVACNGTAAVLSIGAFSCNLSLLAGANTIQVQAADKAGNTATAQISVTFDAKPTTPPNSLLITPSLANMLIGDTRLVALIGDIGQPVSGATWSINDPTIVSITANDPPQLTALAQGTATLTANFSNLTATMTINVLPGAAVPPGTPFWAFDPLPGNTIIEMVPGNPVNPGDPDLYAVESPNSLRAFNKDGLQLWAVLPGASPNPTASLSAFSPIQAQSTTTSDPGFSLAAIPTDVQNLLRKRGGFQNSDLLPRQPLFLEQYRRRGPPGPTASASISGSSFASPLSQTNTALALTTLLIKSVPDNSGGTINLLESFTGCCQLVQASLIKIDNSSQQQVWRQDFSNPIDENFAIGDDDTIYTSQLILPAVSSIFDPFGSAIGSLIFAIDGATGQQKFSVPLPPGHFKLTDTEGSAGNSNLIVLVDVDVAAQPGPLSILPDGSINAVVSTVHLQEDFQRIFSGGGSEIAVSDHKTLQLLTIQPDGSFANQTIQAFDFDQPECQLRCNDASEGYIPNEVVPDGEGGLLATWTGNDSQLGITRDSAAIVRHIDNAGGILDYALPFAGSSWFRLGGLPNPQSLVLGENGTASASDGQSVITFDVNAGTELWSFKPSGFQGIALLAGTVDGGLIAIQLADVQGTFDAVPNTILSFDSTGVVNAATPFAGSNSDLSYFNPNTLLTVAATGQGGGFQGLGSFLDEANLWNLPFANLQKHRNPNAPKIKIDKVITGDDGLLQTTTLPLIGIANQQAETVRISSNQALNPLSKFAVQLTLQMTGSGSATFSDGSTSMKITPTQQKPALVQLQGVTASSKADDLSLVAKIMKRVVGSQNFSVVSVKLGINTNGRVSPDNSVRNDYVKFSGVGSDSIGPVIIPFSKGILSGCRTSVELFGTVTPPDYKGKVVLRRNLLEASAWVQNTFQSIAGKQPDNSFPENRDDDPGTSKGHIYDLDLPGLKRAQTFVGLIKRFRQNFSEFAVLDSEDNGIPVSQQPLPWYSRTSCNVTNAAPQFINDIPGDNQAGQGCTKLSLDLQSNDNAGTVCTQGARRAVKPFFRLVSAGLPLPSFINVTLAKCELLAKANSRKLIEYLKETNPEGSDPQCIEFALKQLGNAKLPDAVPVLALYLTFRRPETDLEKMGMGGQLGTPGNDFPAVWALAQVGKASLPTLAHTIEIQKSTSEASQNATYATALIFNKGAGAIKFLLHHAAVAKSNMSRQRFTAAAQQGLNWCRDADRPACESALAQTSK